MKKYLRIFAAAVAMLTSTSPAFASIHEDWVWNYKSDGWVETGDWKHMTDYVYSMKFDGTTEIDGVIWNNFKTISATATCWDFDIEQADSESPWKKGEIIDLPTGMTFLIREEDGRFYEYVTEISDQTYGYVNWMPEETGEKILYDFNCVAGDVLSTIDNSGNVFEGWTWDEDFKVTEVKELTIQDRDYKVFFTEGCTTNTVAVEDLGWVEMGIMPFAYVLCPTTWPQSSGIIQHWPDFSWTPALVNITDLDGNEIFNPGMLAEVKEITSDGATPSDHRIFDMMGREVKQPQPGGVYIRGGRKFIGR